MPESGKLNPTIDCTKNGPYMVKNLEVLIGIDGKPMQTRPTMALCRFGGSAIRPFCDGTHWYENFRDDGKYRCGMMGELKENEPQMVDVEGVALSVTKIGDQAVVKSQVTGHQLQVTIDERWQEILVSLDEVRSLIKR